MTDLTGLWLCTHCGEYTEEGKLKRDGSCPVCSEAVEIIKPQVQRELSGIEREFGEYGVQDDTYH